MSIHPVKESCMFQRSKHDTQIPWSMVPDSYKRNVTWRRTDHLVLFFMHERVLTSTTSSTHLCSFPPLLICVAWTNLIVELVPFISPTLAGCINNPEYVHACHKNGLHSSFFSIFLNKLYMLTSRNFSTDILNTQPCNLTIVERAKDKGTPCWIRTNYVLTTNEDLFPLSYRGQ